MMNRSNNKKPKFIAPSAESLISKRRVFTKEVSKLAIVRRINISPVSDYHLNFLNLKKKSDIQSKLFTTSQDPYSTTTLPNVKYSSNKPSSVLSESCVYHTENSRVLVRKYNGDFSLLNIRKDRDPGEEMFNTDRYNCFKQFSDVVSPVSKVEIVSKSNNQLKVTVDTPFSFTPEGNLGRSGSDVQTPRGNGGNLRDPTSLRYQRNLSPDINYYRSKGESSDCINSKSELKTNRYHRSFMTEMEGNKDISSRLTEETYSDIKKLTNFKNRRIVSPQIVIRQISLNNKKKYLVL